MSLFDKFVKSEPLPAEEEWWEWWKHEEAKKWLTPFEAISREVVERDGFNPDEPAPANAPPVGWNALRCFICLGSASTLCFAPACWTIHHRESANMLFKGLTDYDDDTWQPMETAPKDGSSVLVWNDSEGDGFCEVARYNGREWVGATECRYTHYLWPSYWTPLPEPPEVERSKNPHQ